MRLNPIHAVLIGAAFSLSGAVFAQAGADQPSKTESFTHGESKRCESMTGTAKEECDREEATKAEGAQAESADAPPDPANSPASAGATGTHFTHGESKRCETMTGAAKEQCDKQEATK